MDKNYFKLFCGPNLQEVEKMINAYTEESGYHAVSITSGNCDNRQCPLTETPYTKCPLCWTQVLFDKE